MRRVSSSQQQIRSIPLGTEQCVQRHQGRGNPAPRATSHAHRARPWLLVLLASLCGFGFLIGIWTWLPPSTVLGVTAQAQQAQQSAQHQARAQHSRSAPLTSSVPDHLPTPHDSGSAAGTQSTAAASHSLAAGFSLVKQAQEQLQQQKLQQQQKQQRQHTAGRGSFRGSTSNSADATMSSTTALQQQQAGGTAAPAAPPPSARVVVVGGGLAGLVAALQAAECMAAAAAETTSASAAAAAAAAPSNGSIGCLPTLCGGGGGSAAAAVSSPSYAVDVLLVEKMPKLGGNSAKASSGINALHPEGGDSEELFRGDVVASGGGASRPELVEELVRGSPAALAFLAAHGAPLTGVTRLGGHSVPRTRTVSGGANVGWVLMSALMEAVRKQPRIQVLEGYALRRILTTDDDEGPGSGGGRQGKDKAGAVRGIELAPAGGPDGSNPAASAAAAAATAAAAAGGGAPPPATSRVSCGALVLATGGFAANRALLKTVSPEAAELATTNGPWARGESLDLAAAAGAALEGLEDVQVHPTGFVDPQDPEAGTKFLAPEKLRGVGGLLLSKEGVRFVDELGRRDVVAGALMRLPGREAWLLLGRDAGAEYGTGALDFYCKRGLMVKAESLAAAAAAMAVPEARLREQLMAYSKLAAAAAATGGQNGGGGGASADPYGKRVFPHPPDPETQLPLYLARITPVVHYTMGGVAINKRAEVLRAGPGGAPDGSGTTIKGLYAAGEVSGGLHGHNRLGGNSLLECAVFGRIAGAQAASCSTP